MIVNVYKGWTGKEFESFDFPEGAAIKDCVKEVDWDNAVILCNGNRVNENYVLKEKDVVAIRETPSAPVLIGAAVVIAAFGIAEAVSYATTGKELFHNIRDWLMPDVSSASNSEQTQLESLPTLRGASNQNIRGKPVPFIVGQTRIAPYKVGTGYHSVSGEDGETHRYHQLYVIGYNDIRAGMFKFDETDFAYNGMSESYDRLSGYKLEIGEGTKKGYITDFEEKSPFAKASPELSIASNGEVPGFSVKVTEEGIGKQIINANGSKLKFTRASDRYPRSVEVEIAFNGLISYDDEGNEQEASAQICVGYSLNGGKSFSPFSTGFVNDGEIVKVDDEDIAAGITGSLRKSTIKRKKNKTMRFVTRHVFKYEEFKTIESAGNGYVWIRVERDDPDSTDTKTINKAYLAYIRTRVYDKEKSDAKGMAVSQSPVIERLRDKTTRCGVSIDATENVSDMLGEFNCMAVAECRTWNGSRWSDEKSPTDNPAANALNVMQSAMLGDFAYPDGKIDLAEFGRLYEFCSSKEFSVGTALTSRKKLSEVVDNILIQARAYRTVSGQKYSVFIDKPINLPVCILNNSNILKDGVGNSKEFSPLPDGFRIRFVNRNIGYDEDEVYVMFNKSVSYDDPTAVIESLDMPFVTDPRQVSKNAWFEYGKRKLRPELWKRPVTTEANLIEIGSRVELQDDTIQVGLGGGWITKVYIKDGMVIGFQISSKINISDLGKSYGARITHATDESLPDIMVRKLSVKEAGYWDDFELETPVLASNNTAPYLGDLVSIGEYGRETVSAICLGKKDKGNGRFELTLVPYSSGLYSIDSGAKVEFYSSVSSVQRSVVKDMFGYAGKSDIVEAVNKAISGIVLEAYDRTPPTVPSITNAESTDVGNVQITFSPSSDEGSGMLRYELWRRPAGSSRWQSVATVYHDEQAGSYFCEDKPTVKFKDYEYAVSAYDRMNNESEKSAAVSVFAEVTRKPAAPKPLSAEARMDWIEVQYSHVGGVDASEIASAWEYEVSKDGGATWAPARKGLSGYYSRYMYVFDRDDDGWPEADELDGLRFRARVVSAYGLYSDWGQEIRVDTSSYLGWTPELTDSSALAEQNVVILDWNSSARIYGAVSFEIWLGEEKVAEQKSRRFYWRFADFKEKEDLDELEFMIVAKSEAGKTDEASPEIDTSGYLGYKVQKPWIKATARKEGIDVSWDKTNDFYGKAEFVLLKDGEEAFRSAREKSLFLPFGEDEFPEKDDILAISLQVRLEGDADSATSDAAETDVSGYLTYIPAVPKVYPSASGRNASLSWDAQDRVYDFTGCEIQVAKGYRTVGGKMIPVTDAEELEWYAPALGLNPYESLENYKRGEAGGFLEVRGLSVSLTLPLFGQDGEGASDTPYAFRLRGRSAAGRRSEWTEAAFVVCKAVSAYDVTKAWDLDDNGERIKVDGALGANQIFVEQLSAISANLGFITDGAMRGNEYNYWAVGDVPMEDGSTMWRGAFRVGGKDQYILVEPRLEDGAPTGEYDITFVVGNFSVSATGTQIRNGSFEVLDEDGNLMFSAAPEGSRIRVLEVEHNSKEYRADLPAFPKDENPLFLTAKDGDDAFVFVPSVDGGEYKVDVYEAGLSDAVRVWTMTGAPAISIFSNIQIGLFYALADDGKFLIFGTDGYYNFGVYAVDVRDRTAKFTALQDMESAIDGWDIDRILSVGGCLFMYLSKTERIDATDYRRTNVALLTEGGASMMFPGGGEYDLLGFAVHGGHAYAAMQSSLFTVVTRRSLASGAAQFLAFVGAVNTMKNNIADTVNSLMVDDERVTLFGVCRLPKAANELHEAFVGAARIPLASAAWNDWDGSSDFPDSPAITQAVEGYRYSDVPENEEKATAPLGAFLLEGRPAAMDVFVSDGGLKVDARLLSFSDADEPEDGLAVIRGALVPETFWSISVTANNVDYGTYYEVEQKAYACLLAYGAEFPASPGGLDAVRTAFVNINVGFSGIESIRPSVDTLFLEQRSEVTGSGVHSAGVGFSMISRDPAGGRVRYCLDTGAFIEFDEDGNLIAQGEKGRDGVDGRDGKDGRDGVDGTIPEISVTATVDGGTGEPSVDVRKTGTAESQSFALEFKNLKGERGEKGDKGDTGERGIHGRDGKDGVSIANVEQTETSVENGGTNVMTVYDSGGNAIGTFSVKNGLSLTDQQVFDISHPVKDIYVQFPQRPDPHELYNVNGIQSTWEVIDYNGAFFRAQGGKADTFKTKTDVLTLQSFATAKGGLKAVFSGTNKLVTQYRIEYQRGDLGGSYVGITNAGRINNGTNSSEKGYGYNISYTPSGTVSLQSNDVETRPNNYTIRIWERKA